MRTHILLKRTDAQPCIYFKGISTSSELLTQGKFYLRKTSSSREFLPSRNFYLKGTFTSLSRKLLPPGTSIPPENFYFKKTSTAKGWINLSCISCMALGINHFLFLLYLSLFAYLHAPFHLAQMSR